MKKKLLGKIVLNKETISELGRSELAQIKGGDGDSIGTTSACLSIFHKPGCSPLPPTQKPTPTPTGDCLSEKCSEIPD